MRLISIILILITLSCQSERSNSISNFDLESLNSEITWSDLMSEQFKVLYFLSPECPLSQNYTKTIYDFNQKFQEDNLEIVLIFPGQEYSVEEIKSFLIKFNLDFPAFLDPNLDLTKSLQAEITPEVFLLDNNNSVLYSGAIDNWAISLGQKRSVVSAYYLNDAVESAIKGEEILIKKTEAVGCFIQ